MLGQAYINISPLTALGYIIICLLPIVIHRHRNRGGESIGGVFPTLNMINFRKLIYRSTAISVYRTISVDDPNYLFDVKRMVVKGHRNIELGGLSIPKEIQRFIRLVVNEETETVDEATDLLLDTYRLMIKNGIRRLEIRLTILVTTYVFFPLLGIVLYSILGDMLYSILLLTLQITVSELLFKGVEYGEENSSENV
jgi:hypothetical protein